MRSPLPALVRTALVGALAVGLLAGCSKKTVAPNSLTQPEGQQNGQLLLVGWPETGSVWFTIADPATPETPSDDFVQVLGVDYWADPNGVRCSALDASPSNQLEAFRVGTDGNAQPLFDYLLPPQLRFIGSGLDLYQFEDLHPSANPSYYGRGALDGVRTPASPVTNRVDAAGPVKESLSFLVSPKGAAGDSVLNVQWSEDPEAAFYVIELHDANDVLGNGSSYANERRLRAIPSPLFPGTRPLHSAFLLLPAGTGANGFNIEISSRVWPLSFHVRITAYNAQGRMVNRLNNYLRTQVRDGNLNLTTMEPLGGAIEVLDPYPNPVSPVPVPDVFTSAQAFALLASVGGGVPTQTALLSGSPLAGGATTPMSAALADAFARFERDPRFSAETARQNLAAIRSRMEQGGAAATVERSAAIRR